MNPELEKVINAFKTLISRDFVGHIYINFEKPLVTNEGDFEEIRKQFGIAEFCVLDSVSFVAGTWKWYIMDTYINSVSLKVRYDYNKGKIEIKEVELTSYPKK